MYAIGVGLTTVFIAYSVLYLTLSRKFKFRFSMIIIISSIVISSYITGVVQLKFLPSAVRTASGVETNLFSLIFVPLIISMVAILIPQLFKRNNQGINSEAKIEKTINTDEFITCTKCGKTAYGEDFNGTICDTICQDCMTLK